jgi:predicted HicB family RNase H-like nuclease
MHNEKFEPVVLAKWYDFMARSNSPISIHQGNMAALKVISDWKGQEVRDLIKQVSTKVNKFNAKNQSNGAIIRAPFMGVICARAEKTDHIVKAV